jgi:FKBP-type peptidyl-prolyl cis-trans isomerase 2
MIILIKPIMMHSTTNKLWCIAVIIGFVCAAIFVAGCVAPEEKGKPSRKHARELRVQYEDIVTVDYTGRFKTDNGQMVVFDTTFESVGTNKSISKSLTFDPDKRYGSIDINVGRGDITPNKGFDDELIGMREGETKVFTVYPDKAWGTPVEALIRTIPLEEYVPLYETLTITEFEKHYPDEVQEVGVTLTHYFWNWTIYIEDITEDTITILNDPYGKVTEADQEPLIVRAYGYSWDTMIVAVSSADARITVRHLPTSAIINTVIDSDDLAVYNKSFDNIADLRTEANQPRATEGIIEAITHGIRINFNHEPVGKILEYEVTVIKIAR